MLLSGGELVLSDLTPSYTYTRYLPATGISLTGLFATYGQIYKKQEWVYVVVRKRSLATARLPIKVYERRGKNDRVEARDDPYAQLLRQPNPIHDPFFFFAWTSATADIYGEALWLKVRGPDRKPRELWPAHPSNFFIRKQESDLYYDYVGGLGSVEPLFSVPASDVVHFKSYNPESTIRGMSALEPLRLSLLNDDAARRAAQAFWQNAGRPSVALSHPKKLTNEAAQKLKERWEAVHGGVDNFAQVAILEEGMEPKILSMSAEEAQYIESRKLSREEVCAAYDVPPPVVHILDRATFSNITEQMRSMYRDTMAPHLGALESVMDHQLRPDFGDDTLYAEFLMDEVLRGDYEVRMEANQKAVGTAQLTPNEARALENRPALPGGDRLYINSTLIPVDEVSSRTSPNPPAEDVSGAKPAVSELKPGQAPVPTSQNNPPPARPMKALDRVMGRLGRVTNIHDIDAKALVEDLNGDAPMVLAQLEAAQYADQSVEELRDRLRRVLWVKE